jgi:DnaJ-domain-containing protein 1
MTETNEIHRDTVVDKQDALSETIHLMTDLIASYLADGTQCSEFELIKWLQAPDQGVFRADAMSDSVTLFRSHFLVMHCLYQLRNHWLTEQRGFLEISALNIILRPVSERAEHTLKSAIAQQDPLAAYYLDLNELETDEESIDALLNDFWRRMVIPDNYDADLATLELQPPVDSISVRQQYRRLAMRHHPDKGGDGEQFRRVSAAYQRLKQGF